MATTNTNHSALASNPSGKPSGNPSGTPLAPAPIVAVLALTFLGSLGTGAVTNGFSFIATEGLGYGRKMNLLLALILGASYIIGALLAGKLVAKLALTKTSISARSILASVLVVIAIACQLPILATIFAPDYTEHALWGFIIIFSPATGLFWPIVESYLSGGRTGKSLRSAIGRFNITWSIALVAAFWMMAPLLEHNPFLIISILGALQLSMCIILCWFPSNPPKHLPEHHSPCPDIYVPLLTMFRMMLIASYIVISALSPLLPIVEDKLGVDIIWKTPLASAWLTARVILFFLFERWHGWHGKWWTPWTGMGLLLIGFSACMCSPIIQDAFTQDAFTQDGINTQSTNIGLIVLTIGLLVMGIGMAITYCGALYYALAVGNSQVDASGKHEAVIGLGYTLGPICGLLGLWFADGDPDAFRIWVILLVGACVIVSGVLAMRLIRSKRT